MNGNNQQILRKPEISLATGLNSTSQFYYIKDGLLPPYIQLGARAVGLMKFEVDAIMAARSAGYTDDQLRALVKRLVEQRKQSANAFLEALVA